MGKSTGKTAAHTKCTKCTNAMPLPCQRQGQCTGIRSGCGWLVSAFHCNTGPPAWLSERWGPGNRLWKPLTKHPKVSGSIHTLVGSFHPPRRGRMYLAVRVSFPPSQKGPRAVPYWYSDCYSRIDRTTVQQTLGHCKGQETAVSLHATPAEPGACSGMARPALRKFD